MKSILERALVHLLNEDNEKAEELLHQFVIEQARNIHESLRESDDGDLEEMGEGDDQFFTEADLADAEVDGAVDDLGDDLGGVPQDTAAGDLGDDTLDAEVDGLDGLGGDDAAIDGVVADEGDVTAEMDNFEQELADLQAKFDTMVAAMEDDGMSDVSDEDDLGVEADAGAEVADEDNFGGEEGGEVADEDGLEADEFDDITESIVDELQKITTPNVEGKGANGEQLQSNKASVITGPKGTAKPTTSKAGGEHKGFARETAPGTTPLKGGTTVSNPSVRNVRQSADTGNTKVSKEGDKGASLNKAPATQDRSVIPGKGGKK